MPYCNVDMRLANEAHQGCRMRASRIAITLLMSLTITAAAQAAESREEVCVAKSVAELSTSQNSNVVVKKIEASVVKIPGPVLRLYTVTLSLQSEAKTSSHEFRCRDDGGEVTIVQRRVLP